MGPTELSAGLAGCTEPLVPGYTPESGFICTVRHSRNAAATPIWRRHGSRLCTWSQSSTFSA